MLLEGMLREGMHRGGTDLPALRAAIGAATRSVAAPVEGPAAADLDPSTQFLVMTAYGLSS